MRPWPQKRLGDICELINGRAFKPHEWEESGLPIVRIQNLNDNNKPFNYTTQVLPEKFRVRPGDILLSWSGTPGTSFGCFRWSGPEGWLNQHIFNVHLREKILPGFFIYQINSKLDELIGKAHGGVGLQHITKGALSSVEVKVPPLAEQERIVKLLDEADQLRKVRAQADRRTADLIPALFHEMFDQPRHEAGEWTRLPLGSVALRVTVGYVGPTSKWYREQGVPFLRTHNVGDLSIRTDQMRYVAPEFNERIKKSSLREGDVIISRVISDEVNCAIVPPELAGANCANIVIVTPGPRLDAHFLALLILTVVAQNQLVGASVGSAQSVVNTGSFKNWIIPIPPLPLQRAFAKHATEIRALEAKQTASRVRLDALFQSMLYRAFNSDL